MNKNERITIRVSEDEKKEISIVADRYKMNTSEFISLAIKDKIELEKLNDSQGQFLKLFDVAFNKSNDPFFKQMMLVLNRIEFNTRWSLKQQDIFMQHLKIPQTMDELNVSIIDHPITTKAQDLVLKDIRQMASHKKDSHHE